MKKDCGALVIAIEGNCLHASWYMYVVDPALFIVSLTPREFSLAA
jgi:hypothetical protein